MLQKEIDPFANPTQPPILDLLMAKLGLNSGVVKGDGGGARRLLDFRDNKAIVFGGGDHLFILTGWT